MCFGGTNLLRLEKERAKLGMFPLEMMSSPIGLPPNWLPHTESLRPKREPALRSHNDRWKLFIYIYENLKVLFTPCAFHLTYGGLHLSDSFKCVYIPVQNILLYAQ